MDIFMGIVGLILLFALINPREVIPRHRTEDVNFILGCILAVCVLTSSVSYLIHVEDLGIVRGQQEIINVYEKRVKSLEERLDKFHYPANSTISLNADTPVAAIVTALSEAEESLARARHTKAGAVVDITKRKIGPWSFIVDYVGEN